MRSSSTKTSDTASRDAGVKHRHFMEQAFRLGMRGQGVTGSNPAVGCVVVSADGAVVGAGWTQSGGRPHAETVALDEAGSAARGGTAYVTLEPCSHTGKTAPCADALVKAELKSVFFALLDPDPRVAGRGAEKLRQAGIEVHEGLMRDEASQINAGFLSRVSGGRPHVTFKLAVSKNGFMRTPDGEPPWITGALSRNIGHMLRATHDAIVTGRGTLETDDPSLDCRLPGLADCSPLPVVMSRSGYFPVTSKLAQRAATQTIVLACEGEGAKVDAHRAELCQFNDLQPSKVLENLAVRGVNRVLLECGPQLAAAFLEEACVDDIALFEAPHEVAMRGESDMSRMGL
ncbi:MAG: bifunctional diaminohydroxyphosphoribosylaminopyrimidine deaminase/5-amino-6-(5-phosphoribosylamino)uracil reductase RibD, partial [Pseudomonadota bacterium]|nr:bifunctional diaminohydroxyphosphoribosylaminopyrimidine deaminase/5-amino-6-(5-phosphoribosylamino)uracil reductase RibD [Pseudomonadota bacterium]